MRKLAELYEKGEHLPKSLVLAYAWYSLSEPFFLIPAHRDSVSETRKALEPKLTGRERALAQALFESAMKRLKLSTASLDDPFYYFEQYTNDRYGRSNQEGSEIFAVVRRRLGEDFDAKLLEFIGEDLHRYLLGILFLQKDVYLNGLPPKPLLVDKIIQRGLERGRSIPSGAENEGDLASIYQMAVFNAHRDGDLKRAAQYKKELEERISKNPSLIESLPFIDDKERSIYHSIGSRGLAHTNKGQLLFTEWRRKKRIREKEQKSNEDRYPVNFQRKYKDSQTPEIIPGAHFIILDKNVTGMDIDGVIDAFGDAKPYVKEEARCVCYCGVDGVQLLFCASDYGFYYQIARADQKENQRCKRLDAISANLGNEFGLRLGFPEEKIPDLMGASTSFNIISDKRTYRYTNVKRTARNVLHTVSSAVQIDITDGKVSRLFVGAGFETMDYNSVDAVHPAPRRINPPISRITLEGALAAYDAEDYTRAYGLLTPLANRGDPVALYTLGEMHLNGRGVARDDALMAYYWSLAIEKGHVKATLELANFYLTGKPPLPLDHEKAARLYRKAAEVGEPEAQFFLSLLLHEGIGVQPDPVQSLVWLKRSAANNHYLAQHRLAEMHRLGDGVTADEAKAAELYSAALASARGDAESGDPDAQYIMGAIHVNGLTTVAKREEGLQWLLKSAFAGRAEALQLIRTVRILKNPNDSRDLVKDGVEAYLKKDLAAAHSLFQKAAAHGSGPLLYNKAFEYIEGPSVNEHMGMVEAMIRAAALHGYDPAAYTLFHIHLQKSASEEHAVQAYAWAVILTEIEIMDMTEFIQSIDFDENVSPRFIKKGKEMVGELRRVKNENVQKALKQIAAY